VALTPRAFNRGVGRTYVSGENGAWSEAFESTLTAAAAACSAASLAFLAMRSSAGKRPGCFTKKAPILLILNVPSRLMR